MKKVTIRDISMMNKHIVAKADLLDVVSFAE